MHLICIHWLYTFTWPLLGIQAACRRACFGLGYMLMLGCHGLGNVHTGMPWPWQHAHGAAMGMPACLKEVLCACWDAQRRLFWHAHVHVASPRPPPPSQIVFLQSVPKFIPRFQRGFPAIGSAFRAFFGFRKSLKKIVESRLENFPTSRLDFSQHVCKKLGQD